MMRNIGLKWAVVLAGLLLAGTVVGAGAKPRRASPPQWPAEVTDIFFSDAREKLVGERPDFGTTATVKATPATAPTDEPPPGAGGVFAWSAIISAEAIEDEIKAQQRAVDATVTVPGAFKGGGFKRGREQFSVLAVMFAIAGEYDGTVRWREDAPGLRDLFARAGHNCKVGTDQSYNEAKLRKDDLGDLVRGDRIDAAKAADAKASWGDVADRPPLMARLEEANQERLGPWLASKAEFSGNLDQVRHEAQLMAAMAEVIQREGFEYWDDDGYLEYAKQLKQAALDVVDAVKLKDYDKARAAGGEITKSCSECHESYRG